ncbi:MAG TPA: hypothetical protein PK951_10895, partial [Chitinophagaceae bacterium]|nr:hypothetical protein [Chitinophagaceae bacterium]
MSKNFTPASTAVRSCTQSPAPVFCCMDTTALPVRKSLEIDTDAQPCSASFFLLFSYRRKRFAYSYKPLPGAKQHAGSMHNSTTSLPKTIGINTSCFMRKSLRQSGFLA